MVTFGCDVSLMNQAQTGVLNCFQVLAPCINELMFSQISTENSTKKVKYQEGRLVYGATPLAKNPVPGEGSARALTTP